MKEAIIRCIVQVHRTLGPGFLESVYRNALLIELRRAGLRAEAEREIRVSDRSEDVGLHRLDIVVNDERILELKAVADLNRVHYEILRAYLKAAGLRIGLLVDFSKALSDFRRVEL